MRKLLAPLVAVLMGWVVLVGAGGVGAQSPAESVFAGYTEFAPLMFSDADGRATGFSVELLRDAATANGFDIEFVAFDSIADLTEALIEGRIQTTPMLADTPARRRIGQFTVPAGHFRFELVFAATPSRAALNGDLDGLRIAVNEGSAPHKLLSEYEGVDFMFSGSIPERLFALLSGQIDAVAAPQGVFQAAANEIGLAAKLSPETYAFASLPGAFLVSPDRPDVLLAFNSHLDELEANGRLEAYEDAWLAQLRPTLLDRLSLHTLPLILTFSLVVACLIGGTFAFVAYRRTARREALRMRSLMEALNAARAGIVVFHASGQLQISNLAFDRAFPGLVNSIGPKGGVLQLIEAAGRLGYLGQAYQDQPSLNVLHERLTTGWTTPTDVMLHGVSDRDYSCFFSRLTDGRLTLVATDVTEIEQGRRAIEVQAGELTSANKQLETFAHAAAHDLKAPASSAATLLDWIREDLREAGIEIPTNVAEALERAQKILRRQVGLIEDLLSYSRASKTRQTHQVLNPTDRIRSVVDLLEVPGRFEVKIAPDIPLVFANRAAFELVFRNILANAIKHHDRSSGRIEISAEQVDNDMVQLVIEDDGPGVDPAFTERIFQPFFRLGDHETVEGSGLGLSISQSAVQSWGGQINVGQANPRGTVVRVTVPCAKQSELSQCQKIEASSPACDPSAA